MSINEIQEATMGIFQHGIIGFLITLVVIVLSLGITLKVTKKAIKNMTKKNRIDETSARFSYRIISAIVYTLAIFGIIMQVNPLRQISVTLLASSGVAVLVLGFAAQEAFSNIIAGFFISFFRPFSVGELIILPGQNISGRIEDINLRHTVVRTFENNRIIIPNSTINKSIIENRDITEKKMCSFLLMSISYDSNVDRAKEIMMEEALKHPNLIDIRTTEDIMNNVPQLSVTLVSIGNFSVDLRMGVWSADSASGWVMLSDLRDSIKKRFDQEGIEIPYPYQNVIMKKEA
ncbi:MAG TPA: mechanosensitive ion channel protein MscS [Erysipelotrichaceae bacterium]|nr:mechanosensitive ion channel protein MscS [Erysipelotrichaceae bacterium]